MKTHLPLAVIFSSLFCGLLPSLAAGEPELTQGNVFTYRTASSHIVRTTNGAYIRFTATGDAAATSLSLYLNPAAAPDTMASALTFGLQEDNGAGAPNGVFLASGTVTAPTNGWNTVSLSQSVALEAGKIYHLVANPSSGGIANLRRLMTDDLDALQTFGMVDANYAYGNLVGTLPTNVLKDAAVNFAIGSTSSRGIGMVYYQAALHLLDATNARAQRFRFTTATPGATFLDSVSVRLYLNPTTPLARDVQVTLLDDNDNILSTSLIAAATLTPGAHSYRVGLDQPLALEEGSYYRLALNVVGSGTHNVNWYVLQSGSENAAINASTYQGSQGYAFQYTSADFSTSGTPILSSDYQFGYTTTIPEAGTTMLLLGGGAALWLGSRRRNVRRG